jgi:hypothetical protein
MIDVKIDNVLKDDKFVVAICNDGEVEMYIPFRGNSLDIIRSKFKINVAKKYTTTDIHVIQNAVFAHLGITASATEIEG